MSHRLISSVTRQYTPQQIGMSPAELVHQDVQQPAQHLSVCRFARYSCFVSRVWLARFVCLCDSILITVVHMMPFLSKTQGGLKRGIPSKAGTVSQCAAGHPGQSCCARTSPIRTAGAAGCAAEVPQRGGPVRPRIPKHTFVRQQPLYNKKEEKRNMN